MTLSLSIQPMSRTGGSAGASLVMAGVLGTLPPVGYLERWMNMKTGILCLLSILLLPSVQARFVSRWPYVKLVEKSDLVAIVEVRSIEKLDTVWDGPGNPGLFQGSIAHLDIAWVIKGDAKMQKLDLVFFRYCDTCVGEDNGALLIDFRNPKKHQYLVFLRREASDRYVPATGQYDASISVKQIKQDHLSRVERK